MRITALLLISMLFFGCTSSSEEPATNSDSTRVEQPATESYEAMPITNEYIYEITDKKTGKKKTLTQDEYLQSEYFSNPNVEVRERIKIH